MKNYKNILITLSIASILFSGCANSNGYKELKKLDKTLVAMIEDNSQNRVSAQQICKNIIQKYEKDFNFSDFEDDLGDPYYHENGIVRFEVSSSQRYESEGIPYYTIGFYMMDSNNDGRIDCYYVDNIVRRTDVTEVIVEKRT